MLRFLRIELEGFGSYAEPSSFDFDQGGVFVVRGKNGVGKTTLFSALVWALYRTSLKNITAERTQTWQRLRPDSFRGTRVIVFFQKDGQDFAVARHISFKGKTFGLDGKSSLLIFSKISGEDRDFDQNDLVTEALHTVDVQAYVTKTLGMDSRVFLNSVLFGQRMKRLVEAEGEDKRKMFETLFDLEFIQRAKEKGQAIEAEASSELGIVRERLAGIRRQIEFTQTQLSDAKQRELSFDQERKGQIGEIEDEIIRHRDQIGYAQRMIEDCEDELKQIDVGDLETLTTEARRLEGLVYEKKQARIARTEQLRNEHNLRNADKEREASEKRAGLNGQINELSVLLRSMTDKYQLEHEELSQAKKAVESEKAELTSRFVSAEREENRALAHKSKLQSELDCLADNCPTCGQTLPEESVKAAEKSLASQIKAEQEVVEKMLELKEGIRKDIEEKSFQLEGFVNTIQALTEQFNRECEAKTEEREALLSQRDALMQDTPQEGFHEDNIIDTTYHELLSEERELGQQWSLALGEVEKAEKVKDRIGVLTLNHKESKEALEKYAGKIQDCEEQITKLRQQRRPDFGVAKLEKSIEDFEAEIVEEVKLEEQLVSRVQQAQWWVKTGFGASGLKAYVFSAMLERLNELVVTYADRLGFSVSFGVDLSKPAKPFVTKCLMEGEEVMFAELSGGQQQRVDLCVAFAMHDLIAFGAETNLLIMDEPFEGLDEEGMEAAFDLLRVKAAPGKTVFIITHLPVLDALNAREMLIIRDPETKLSRIA